MHKQRRDVTILSCRRGKSLRGGGFSPKPFVRIVLPGSQFSWEYWAVGQSQRGHMVNVRATIAPVSRGRDPLLQGSPRRTVLFCAFF